MTAWEMLFQQDYFALEVKQGSHLGTAWQIMDVKTGKDFISGWKVFDSC
jgi:hypothetical protein